jgi:hypothetical protein
LDSTDAAPFQETAMEDIEYIDPDYDWYTPDDERDSDIPPQSSTAGSPEEE